MRIKKKKKANTIKREAEVGLASVNAWKHAVLELRRHLNGEKKKRTLAVFYRGSATTNLNVNNKNNTVFSGGKKKRKKKK